MEPKNPDAAPTEKQLDYIAALLPAGTRLPDVRTRAEASELIRQLKSRPPDRRADSSATLTSEEQRVVRDARARMAPRPDFLTSAARHRSSHTPPPG